MSGLTAAYINWKMASEGTTAATKSIILDFLNAAPTAATIAGIEPVEGPVVDETGVGYGDQVRDYDIGITVAQRIINNESLFLEYWGQGRIPQLRVQRNLVNCVLTRNVLTEVSHSCDYSSFLIYQCQPATVPS